MSDSSAGGVTKKFQWSNKGFDKEMPSVYIGSRITQLYLAGMSTVTVGHILSLCSSYTNTARIQHLNCL